MRLMSLKIFQSHLKHINQLVKIRIEKQAILWRETIQIETLLRMGKHHALLCRSGSFQCTRIFIAKITAGNPRVLHAYGECICEI